MPDAYILLVQSLGSPTIGVNIIYIPLFYEVICLEPFGLRIYNIPNTLSVVAKQITVLQRDVATLKTDQSKSSRDQRGSSSRSEKRTRDRTPGGKGKGRGASGGAQQPRGSPSKKTKSPAQPSPAKGARQISFEALTKTWSSTCIFVNYMMDAMTEFTDDNALRANNDNRPRPEMYARLIYQRESCISKPLIILVISTTVSAAIEGTDKTPCQSHFVTADEGTRSPCYVFMNNGVPDDDDNVLRCHANCTAQQMKQRAATKFDSVNLIPSSDIINFSDTMQRSDILKQMLSPWLDLDTIELSNQLIIISAFLINPCVLDMQSL